MEYSDIDFLGRKKRIPAKLLADFKSEIKMLLHAHRDCLRNRWNAYQETLQYYPEKAVVPARDPKVCRFDVNDGYYGEAFGIIRAMHLMGYGDYGANSGGKYGLFKWFDEIKDEVLTEEGFKTNHQCDYCLERYHKDDTRTRPW